MLLANPASVSKLIHSHRSAVSSFVAALLWSRARDLAIVGPFCRARNNKDLIIHLVRVGSPRTHSF